MEKNSNSGSKQNTTFWIIVGLILTVAVATISFSLFRSEIESESMQNKERAKTIAKAIKKEEHPIYLPGRYSVNFSVREGYWYASALACDKDLIKLAKAEPITKLSIKNSEITEVGFTTLLQEPVEELLLFKPHLTSKEMKVISSLQNLKILSLRDSRAINDSLLLSLTGPQSLNSLSLRDTGISDIALVHISKTFPNLKSLNLRKCRKVSINGIEAIAKLTKLETLKLNNIDLSRRELLMVSKITSLKKLCLADCKIDDSKLNALKSTSIEKMDLSENPITAKSFDTLSKMQLKYLKMTVCPLIAKDAVVKFKARKPALRVLWSPKYKPDDGEF